MVLVAAIGGHCPGVQTRLTGGTSVGWLPPAHTGQSTPSLLTGILDHLYDTMRYVLSPYRHDR
jgi:hypothetical protein